MTLEKMLRRRLADGYETFQLILPSEFRNQALKGLHDDVGHPGRDRTLDLVTFSVLLAIHGNPH